MNRLIGYIYNEGIETLAIPTIVHGSILVDHEEAVILGSPALAAQLLESVETHIRIDVILVDMFQIDFVLTKYC